MRKKTQFKKGKNKKDDVWRPKALKFGWYLPYEPFHREHGAWKAHYIECVCGINALPLSKEDAYKYREVLYKRELTDVEKENFLYFQNKRDLQDWEKCKKFQNFSICLIKQNASFRLNLLR